MESRVRGQEVSSDVSSIGSSFAQICSSKSVSSEGLIGNEVISNELIKKYETIFHLTLEIKELSFQKYDRQNIEQIVTNFF